MPPIFYIKNGNLSFADKTVLSNIELYISAGDRICLVGKNGSGKSSLMKVICGEYEIDSGELFQNSGINIGYLKQDMKNVPDSTIYDFILGNFKDPENNRYKADIILKELEIDGNLELNNCSGGQIRRAFLAASLVLEPEILLLDEPTNHLDIKSIQWLEEYVKSYQGAIICISHDRTFLENTTNKVWWIDRSVLRKSDKGFKYYDHWRDEIIAAEEAVIRKMNRKLEAEKGWLNTGVTARRKRNQKRLAQLHSLRETLQTHQNKLSQAKAKLQIELDKEVKKTQFIIEAENINFNYPGKNIITNFNIKVKKGEKIGIIGANGCGKSTLIKMLTKELKPISGKIKHGTNLEITYFDQHRSTLNPYHSLKQILCPDGNDHVFLKNREMHAAAYLKQFMFDPKLLNTKAGTLSGGEANRLLLAKALINPGNFLVLDEPTNDLDMDSLEMLLEVLAEYQGTLIIVSHDRDFLERLVTRTLVFTDEKIIDLYGGYQDYLQYHQKSSIPTKSKPKKSIAENNKSTKSLNKLSYKYQRLLEVLPSEIEQLEQKIIQIESELADANIYNANPDKFQKLTKELTYCQSELDQKMQQWLEVENMNN